MTCSRRAGELSAGAGLEDEDAKAVAMKERVIVVRRIFFGCLGVGPGIVVGMAERGLG